MRRSPILPAFLLLASLASWQAAALWAAPPRSRRLVKRFFAGCPATRTRKGGWKVLCAGWRARILPDGSVRFSDASLRWLGLGFTFDLTDAVMRAHGDDPYLAAKLQFLKETRTFRRRMRRAWYRRQGRAFLQALPKMLQGIVRSRLSPADKRRLLFELWDECLETGRSELASMGRLARSRILAFIRKAFPKGTTKGYTQQELVRFNRIRTSKASFDPYGTKPNPLDMRDRGSP